MSKLLDECDRADAAVRGLPADVQIDLIKQGLERSLSENPNVDQATLDLYSAVMRLCGILMGEKKL